VYSTSNSVQCQICTQFGNATGKKIKYLEVVNCEHRHVIGNLQENGEHVFDILESSLKGSISVFL
jgi:hypothetical protein